MSTLYITEFQYLPQLNSADIIVQAPFAPGTAEQRITLGGSSTSSAAFNANTNFVMLHSDDICSLAWSVDSTTPTAVITAQRMAANETRFYGVRAGGKVAAILNT